MKTFYRLATTSDFETYEVPMDHFDKTLPREVEILVEEGDMRNAVQRLRELKGIGIHDCNRYCQIYRKFLKAKQDFENGINVYTEY